VKNETEHENEKLKLEKRTETKNRWAAKNRFK